MNKGIGQSQFIEYDHQNYFQLASIRIAAPGLYVVMIGQQLAIKYGAGVAICSIILGNMILWLIAMAIISMVDRAHANAIENISQYIGKWGAGIVALLLVFSFFNWYALQLNSLMVELSELFNFSSMSKKDVIVRFGAAFGLLTTLLSMGGIRLIKWISVISFPIFLVFCIYSIFSSDISIDLKNTLGISFTAVIVSVISLLPGVINLPTFFRHARSKAHAYFALSIITIFISFFEISTIWIRFTFFQQSYLTFNIILISIFAVLIVVCCNLMNIYSASACWEMIVPRFGGPRGFVVIGLLSTAIYTFIQISTPVQFFEDLSNSYMAVLGVVLLMTFLVRIITRHRLRVFEKSVNIASWFFGCVVATIYETQHFLEGVDALLMGVYASILFFLAVLFFEEMVWAIKKFKSHNRTRILERHDK